MIRKLAVVITAALLIIGIGFAVFTYFNLWAIGNKIVPGSSHNLYSLEAYNIRVLEEKLKTINFWSKDGLVDPNNNKRFTVKKLRIVLTNIPQEYDKFIFSSGELESSWGAKADRGIVTLSIYVNIDLLKQEDRDISAPFNLALLRATYLLTRSAVDYQDPTLLAIQRQFMADGPIFIVLVERQRKKTLFEYFVPKVFAQSCSGGIGCGNWAQTCACSGGSANGSSCTGPNDCPGGSCGCSGECIGEYAGSCSGWTDQNQCVGGPCGWGKCVESGGCSWSSPAPPSAPTSPPAPPPQDGGGGGGCGTCAGCFSDSGGCPSDYPSNAGQGSCSSGNHACCQPACPGGGGGGETCLGQPKPSNCCNSWCRGEQNCYQQESGWWCEDAGWVCEGNANTWSACSPSCGNGQQTNECGGTRNCYTFCCDASLWGAWTSCSGSPATKSRVNQCGTPQSTSCTGTINARAVKVNVGVNTCATVRASTNGINGTVHQFTAGSASQPTPLTQSGASYVTFSGVVGGTYTISPTTPSQDWVLTRACWTRTLNAPTSGEGLSSWLSVPTDGETLTWDLGYLDGTPWVQTGGGGNVYGAETLRSSIPFGTSPRSFSLDGAGGYPGLVSYGTSYDFDSNPTLKGENYVSSKKWLANQTYSPVVNYYEYFRIKLGGPITPSTVQEMGSPQESMSKPPSRTTPYYVVGDMMTSGDWTIPDGETVIFIVNGNLTLGGKVNITGSGFAAFIVNGNITVSSSVGGLYTSSTPVIEGIYVTSPTGIFNTSTSSVPGKERLVLQGMFVAGSFLLERDLDSVNANTTTSSELFLYNPRFLFSMPDSMKDVLIKWEEVAP